MIINSELTLAAQKSVDDKQYKLLNNRHVPYATSGEFLSLIPATRRHIGQTSHVLNGPVIEIWQFKGGIADVNFVKVFPQELSSGGGASRFGIEDNLGVQNRTIDLQNFDFYFNNLGESFDIGNAFSMGAGLNIYNDIAYVSADLKADERSNTHRARLTLESDNTFASSSNRITNTNGNLRSNIYQGISSNGSTEIDFTAGSEETGGVNRTGINMYVTNDGAGNSTRLLQLHTDSAAGSMIVELADPSNRTGNFILPISVNGNVADATGNITVVTGGGTPATIPFYNNNIDAIINGAAQDSMYRLPYLAPGDYYPLALVGPLQLQTFELTIPENCNLTTLSANIQMTNTITNNVYNFTSTRPDTLSVFNPITVTVLQGPYNFVLSNL